MGGRGYICKYWDHKLEKTAAALMAVGIGRKGIAANVMMWGGQLSMLSDPAALPHLLGIQEPVTLFVQSAFKHLKGIDSTCLA